MSLLYPADNAQRNCSRALWDDITKDFFVSLLCAYNPDSPKRYALSKESWMKITKEMKIEFPELSFSTEQLKQLERDLRKKYKSIKSIESQPGFRWDENDNMLKASNDDWQKLFVRDPKARKWHRKILPYYTSLNALYGGYHEVELAKSKQGTSSHLPEESVSMFMLKDLNEELDESLQTNSRLESRSDNSGILLDLTLSPNHDQQPQFQELTDAKMNLQKELPLLSNHGCQRNCRFGIEPMMSSPANANYNFSIYRCITEYYVLLGFQQSDVLYVAEIFRDEQNRELFLALHKSERELWLRASIDGRKQACSKN